MRWLAFGMAAAWACGLGGTVRAADFSPDEALSRAEAFVENSDRYLHHRHLKRGMKGYGLTVFSGTKIERFDVEIVSVVRGFALPRQDVILARLSGQGLEKSRVIAGMSGSPVYVKDPRDGKEKLIGAVAFGWCLATEPQCGLQPITQMLATRGVLPETSVAPTTQPTTRPAKKPGEKGRRPSPPVWGAQPAGRFFPRALWNIALPPGKEIFEEISPPARSSAPLGQLRPLAVPLCVSGCDADLLARLDRQLAPLGLYPVAGGALPGPAAFGERNERELQTVQLQPGSAVSIALVTGDQDWTAIGTVTDVLGDKVLAFGHSLFAEGAVRLPMGTAYIHQVVVRTLASSFKLGSSIRPVGALVRDEEVAVAGRIGPQVGMIPMTVRVEQAEDDRRQVFRYRLVRHRYYTPPLAAAMVYLSAHALRSPPQEHYVRYEVRVDFGELGEYRAVNVTSDEEVYAAISDVARPLFALLNNPFGPAPRVRRIEVNLSLYPGSLQAGILHVKTDGGVYAPGQTVTGTILLEPYRRPRQNVPFSLKLPDDLPDGSYPLTVGDAAFALETRQREQPQDFAPRSVPELLATLRKIVEPRGDCLYLHLPLPRGGWAVGMEKLPALPDGKARMLQQARLPDTRTFETSLVAELDAGYVPQGRATTTISVKRDINETLLRQK